MPGWSCSTRVDAAERGADIRTCTRCVAAERGETWRLTLDHGGQQANASARVLVNATGPWLGRFSASALHERLGEHLRLVKGSHIVVRRLFEHDHGYIFQNRDGRVVFALPFAQHFTLIGTTDQAFTGDPGGVTPSAGEIDYLCAAANGYFRAQISPTDVIWTFAGVRSLYDDGSKKPQDTTRDYVLRLDERYGKAPLLNIYGGKLTTYRRLAEQALDRLAHIVKSGPAWTRDTHLPGGDFPSRRRRCAGRPNARGLAVSVGGACAAAGARLRHAREPHPRHGAADGRSGRDVRRRADRRRGALSHGAGVGAERRRRALAALQARPACHAA